LSNMYSLGTDLIVRSLTEKSLAKILHCCGILPKCCIRVEKRKGKETEKQGQMESSVTGSERYLMFVQRGEKNKTESETDRKRKKG